MLERVKRALVQSYIGAITLGYLLAETIFAFANIFASPLEDWIQRQDYQRLVQSVFRSTDVQLHVAVPHLIRCVLYLILFSILLRWLYLEPTKREELESAPNLEDTL